MPDDPTKPDQTDDFGKLEALLKDVRFTMFTTRVDGRLRSRPMTTIKTDDVGRLWFLTDRDADIAQDVLARALGRALLRGQRVVDVRVRLRPRHVVRGSDRRSNSSGTPR